MTRWLTCIALGLFLTVSLTGCMEEETVSSGTAAKSVAAKPRAKKVVPQKDKKEEVKQEPKFEYVIDGRRDPFVPLTVIKKPLLETGEIEPLTPLQGFDVSQFRLSGVIVGKGDPKAMVIAPDGKAYVLAKGVKIGKNNGVIVDINADAILVEEKYYDFSGNVIENIQEITVPVQEGF